MEKVWENKFNKRYSFSEWASIYKRKIKLLPCVKLKEFNYKLIHNLIYSGYIVNKWKPSVPRNCTYCNEVETTEHLLFNCDRVKSIWQIVGQLIKLDIKWHHLVIGLDEKYAEITNKSKNTVVVITCYSIFLAWIKSGDLKENYRYRNLWNNTKMYLNYYERVFSKFLSEKKWFRQYAAILNLNSIE